MYKALIQKIKKKWKKQKRNNKMRKRGADVPHLLQKKKWRKNNMKILDKIGLIIFANLILIISVIVCLLVFGWLSPETLYEFTKLALNDTVTINILLGISVVCILLAIKCIFFSSDEKQINGIKDGILLQNSDGQLVISKSTLEELVNNVVKGFDSAQDISSKIVLDEENKLIVYVTLNVKENAVIKELSNNLQTKIKSAIKKTSDLEVKEVNISIKELQAQPEQGIE